MPLLRQPLHHPQRRSQEKLEVVQLWRCASCKRLFTPGPAALRNKTYPIRMVLQALTLYNLGYTLGETAKRLKSKAGRAVSPTTIATWIGAHKEQTTFRRLRAEAKTIYPPTQTIRSIKLYHRQVYAFAYHRSKLTLLRRNPQHQRFEALATFLETIPSSCPHELFRSEDDPKARASQAQPAFADINRLIINRKVNTATETAALIIPAVGSNKLRHETLQNFLLANDSSTIAIEIPLWLTEDEISALETRYGIELAAGGAPRTITGHIDFLQVATTPCTFLITNPMRARTSPSPNWRSMRWRSPSACRASNSSTSNARGLTKTNTTSFFRARSSRSTQIKGPVEPGPHALLNILRPT